MDQSPLFEVDISSPEKPCHTQCDGFQDGDVCNALDMQCRAFNFIAEG